MFLLKKLPLLLFLASLGFASYEATTLTPLAIQSTATSPEAPTLSVLVSAKVFDAQDAQAYLGRDLISAGYVPVQITIRNQSSDPLYLSPSNFNIALPPIHEVTDKVHTSTVGRVLAWGIPGLLVWPFLIPAMYDGVKSQAANEALDVDYWTKSVKEQTIDPHTSFNGIVFVARELIANQSLEMVLVNQKTGEKTSYTLVGAPVQ